MTQGALPIWTLNGRPSASADAARLRELERLRAMTVRERMALALLLGLQTKALQAQR